MSLSLVNDASSIVMGLLLLGFVVLASAYVLDLVWNLVRALSDRRRGWDYYFSDAGPANVDAAGTDPARRLSKASRDD